MDTFDFTKLNLKKIRRVIDIGCGNGRHLKSLSFKLHNAEIKGIDHSKDEINKLKDEFNNFRCKQHNSYEFLHHDIRDIPIEDSTQDLVICSEVLEHVPNYEDVISECQRVLKPEGVLLVSVPTYTPEKLCWVFSKKYRQTPGGHIRIFKKKQLIEAFLKCRLNLFCHHREHSFHSIYWILRSRNNMDESNFLKSFHGLLVKQMFGQAKTSAFIEKMLNPLFGKSECFYLTK
ncbi:MAG: class I SAM-dependent methyltransferase [SAR86 cluster bacterium]|uniref:Class I SAM-dependent methyltransferase n=1 Tax=SAR86 cluster bacterium TaxID=2030880 RepID=A0A937IBT0_9GAMM|nr:class I SAM-dependent methyltransferase [SAR86 cluster bacterium]